MKYFSGSGRRRTVRKSMIWMKSRVRPRLASRTVSTRRESPGTKRSSPIRSSGPLGMSRMPVASTTRTPGWPSANRAYQSRTSCVTNPSSVARHGTIAGTHVRSAAPRRVPSLTRENQRERAPAARGGDDRAEVLAHLAELGDQVARADDPPLLVLRDLTRDEQEPPAARLGAVGVADGSRERRRVVELDPLRHGLLPSRTIVSPLV